MTDLPAGEKRVWLRHPNLRIGAIASLLLLLIGFVSIVWVPYPIESINVGTAMQDFGSAHWLGTDHLGRDMISMVMKGTLTSFVVAFVAVAIGAIVGLPLGLAAAAWGGPAEWVTLRVYDFLLIFPALIIAILITAVFGPSAINVMIAVGIVNVPAFARVARDGALRLKGLDYVGAARLAGLGQLDIARRHILPGIASLIGLYPGSPGGVPQIQQKPGESYNGKWKEAVKAWYEKSGAKFEIKKFVEKKDKK